ncbi:MAG: hypothetical protein OXS30_07550 [Chloroflexota bacterium]|nr:hypothetical protein [Chloroflexota bacterium]
MDGRISERGWWASHLLLFEQDEVFWELLAAAFAVDHSLVAGVGEPVGGAIAEDQVVEPSEPVLDTTVGGDRGARHQMTGDVQFLKVDRQLKVVRVQSEVVKDQLQTSRRSRPGARFTPGVSPTCQSETLPSNLSSQILVDHYPNPVDPLDRISVHTSLHCDPSSRVNLAERESLKQSASYLRPQHWLLR